MVRTGEPGLARADPGFARLRGTAKCRRGVLKSEASGSAMRRSAVDVGV